MLVSGMQTPAPARADRGSLGFGAQLAQGSPGRRQQLLEREAQEAASARQAQTRVIVSALLYPAAAGGDAGHGRVVLASARLAGAAARHPGTVLDRGPLLSRRLARHQEPSANMDVLVATGTSAAYFYSLYLLLNLGMAASGQLYFEASAIIITLIPLGKLLEARARRKPSPPFAN